MYLIFELTVNSEPSTPASKTRHQKTPLECHHSAQVFPGKDPKILQRPVIGGKPLGISCGGMQREIRSK